ncbi:unnamed protein product, partial [Darwinula stevensoni]
MKTHAEGKCGKGHAEGKCGSAKSGTHQAMAGLGFRRGLIEPMNQAKLAGELKVDFFELAPENWIGVGGYYGRILAQYTEQYPFVAHGLSLSLGGILPIDVELVKQVAQLMQQHQIEVYSEHLSYCTDDRGHLYDLLPIPFTEEAVHHVSERIQQVQNILGKQIAIENVSYYGAPFAQMTEQEFMLAVLAKSDCLLMLDVNNVYVNHINHGTDPHAFIKAMPAERIVYLHMAGHYQESNDLLIDTHGAKVCDSVWSLLDYTYQCHGVKPTLLERDFNYPPLEELLSEVSDIRAHQAVRHHQQTSVAA